MKIFGLYDKSLLNRLKFKAAITIKNKDGMNMNFVVKDSAFSKGIKPGTTYSWMFSKDTDIVKTIGIIKGLRGNLSFFKLSFAYTHKPKKMTKVKPTYVI